MADLRGVISSVSLANHMPPQKCANALLIFRVPKQVLMPRVRRHPEFLRLTGSREEAVRVFGQSAVILVAADDEHRAFQFADVFDRLHLVNVQLEPLLCEWNHQTGAKLPRYSGVAPHSPID